MTTQSVARLRPEQCSACFNRFAWSASGPTQLFPLLCGHIFCRLCLAKLARNVLSSKDVPLQCCEKLVPNDYIRGVLAHEENMYYLFLLNQARSSAGAAKEANKQPAVAAAGALLARSSASNVGNDLEMKPPVAKAPAAPLAGQDKSTPANVPARPVEPRYITRTSKARLVQQQGGAIATSGLTSNGQPSVAPSHEKYCKCNIWLDESPSIAPCGHRVCRKCLETGIQRYLDMAPFGNAVPVSCCGKVLPLDLVQRIISGRELTTYAKFMVKYSDATTPRTVGTKRKAAPEKKPNTVSQKAKGKAPAKRAKKTSNQADGSSQQCVSCYSSPNKLNVGPCGHGYCQLCLKKMAKTSLSNRSQVPIRCCSKELPIDYVESVLTNKQFQQYQRYVAARDPKKSTLKSDKDYAAVVRKNKGKQCPVCGVGVVKISGCHAMRCSLGHGFCWNCLQSICTCGRIYQYN